MVNFYEYFGIRGKSYMIQTMLIQNVVWLSTLFKINILHYNKISLSSFIRHLEVNMEGRLNYVNNVRVFTK